MKKLKNNSPSVTKIQEQNSETYNNKQLFKQLLGLMQKYDTWFYEISTLTWFNLILLKPDKYVNIWATTVNLIISLMFYKNTFFMFLMQVSAFHIDV